MLRCIQECYESTQQGTIGSIIPFHLVRSVCYFGPRYELHKFSTDAQGVLIQSGEAMFIGSKWIVLALGLFGLGIILRVIGGKGWI